MKIAQDEKNFSMITLPELSHRAGAIGRFVFVGKPDSVFIDHLVFNYQTDWDFNDQGRESTERMTKI